jgi:hypothetical protein
VTDGAFDGNGIIRDALAMITRWAPDAPRVTLLLGNVIAELPAADIAEIYSGKAGRWPRSFTMSDQLVRPLMERIIAAPPRMHEGEVVIIRKDETKLGPLEAGILSRIRSEVLLCPLPDATPEVIAYRASELPACPRS